MHLLGPQHHDSASAIGVKGVPKLITINSWNEWTEGSYLEPDQHFGFGYLEAIRRVFCPEAANP